MTDPDSELEVFFTAARRAAPQPSDALFARIMADAEAAQRTPEAQRPTNALDQLRAWVSDLWRPASGLAAAGVAGLAIGLHFPGAVDPAGMLAADSSFLPVELYSEADYEAALWSE